MAVDSLIDKYIDQFEEAKKLPYHMGNPSYEGAMFGVVELLKEFFGEPTGGEFLERTALSRAIVETELNEGRDALVVYKSFCRHIDTCVAVLRVYQDKLSMLRDGIERLDKVMALIHVDIRNTVVELFANRHYANAVEDACKKLEDLVRRRSGRHDLSGTKLMHVVFAQESPVLMFNEGETESDRSEQRGMMYLYAGAMLALRNPRAHGLLEDKPQEAIEALIFISFLARRLDTTLLNLGQISGLP